MAGHGVAGLLVGEAVGVQPARLRKDAVQSKLKMEMIDTIIDTVKEAESENGDLVEDPKFTKLDPEDQRTRFLLD